MPLFLLDAYEWRRRKSPLSGSLALPLRQGMRRRARAILQIMSAQLMAALRQQNPIKTALPQKGMKQGAPSAHAQTCDPKENATDRWKRPGSSCPVRPKRERTEPRIRTSHCQPIRAFALRRSARLAKLQSCCKTVAKAVVFL